MKCRRKRVQVHYDRNRRHQNRVENGLGYQHIDELILHRGSALGGNRSGQRVLNSFRTSSSTSSAVPASRHLPAISRASPALICESTALTRGIMAGIILRSTAPMPTSNTAYAGVEAISPHK